MEFVNCPNYRNAHSSAEGASSLPRRGDQPVPLSACLQSVSPKAILPVLGKTPLVLVRTTTEAKGQRPFPSLLIEVPKSGLGKKTHPGGKHIFNNKSA